MCLDFQSIELSEIGPGAFVTEVTDVIRCITGYLVIHFNCSFEFHGARKAGKIGLS